MRPALSAALVEAMDAVGVSDLAAFVEAAKWGILSSRRLVQFADGLGNANPSCKQEHYHEALNSAHKALDALDRKAVAAA